MGFKKHLEDSAPFAIRTLWACLIAGPSIWLVSSCITLSGLTASEVAAWIQAIGSIGAIVGACAVANWQIIKSQSQRDSDKVSSLMAIFAVVENAAKHASSVGSMVEQGPPDFAFRGAWQITTSGPLIASQQALSAIPVHELGDPHLVVQCVSIAGALNLLLAEVERYMAEDPSLESTSRAYAAIRIQSMTIAYSWKKFADVAKAKTSFRESR